MSKNKNKYYNTTQRSTSKSTSNNQSQTKSKYFWILFFLIIFWTISGVLGAIAFVENKTSQRYTAYADELTSGSAYFRYDSPNVFVPSNRITKADIPNITYSSLGATSFPMTFSYIVEWLTSNPYLDISFSVAGGTSYYLSSLSKTDNTWVNHGLVIRFNPSVDNNKTYYFALNEEADYVYGTMTLSADLNFNLGTVLSYSYDSTISTINDLHKVTNYIILNDSSNLELRFGLVWYTRSVNNGQAWANKYSWTPRTIYLNKDYSSDEIFQLGKEEGYLQGKLEFENSGFQDGYDRGYAEGEQRGKIIGATESQNYSFLRLMTSVVDAPLQALSGLFNFDILGVNMMDFVTSMFTLMIVVIIIKLCMGGGK